MSRTCGKDFFFPERLPKHWGCTDSNRGVTFPQQRLGLQNNQAFCLGQGLSELLKHGVPADLPEHQLQGVRGSWESPLGFGRLLLVPESQEFGNAAALHFDPS